MYFEKTEGVEELTKVADDFRLDDEFLSYGVIEHEIEIALTKTCFLTREQCSVGGRKNGWRLPYP